MEEMSQQLQAQCKEIEAFKQNICELHLLLKSASVLLHRQTELLKLRRRPAMSISEHLADALCKKPKTPKNVSVISLFYKPSFDNIIISKLFIEKTLASKSDLHEEPLDAGFINLLPAETGEAHTPIDNPELEFCTKPFCFSNTSHIMLLLR